MERRKLHSRRLPWLLGITLLVVLVTWSAWRTCGFDGCPDVDRLTAYQPGGAPVLLDRRGVEFADLAPAEHEVIALSDLPSHVPQAFLAVEDQRFYQHGGIDWRRVVGASLANVRSRHLQQGFSTISMQLARNVFADEIPAQQRTLGRKLLEMRVARAIEERFSKDQILELYLNHIYFGHGARGIAAAARHYFGCSPTELSLSQAATLAAMIKAPRRYDPRENPRRARSRRALVLALMASQGRIEQVAADRAASTPLSVARSRPLAKPVSVAPYFVEEVRRRLERRFGESIYTQPFRIWTTLDLSAQRAAEDELATQLQAIENGAFGSFSGPRYSPDRAAGDRGRYLQGALVAVSASDGDILVWVGGRDFRRSQFDRVRGARRQVGSAFKPFVYAAALEHGFSLSQLLLDLPLQVTRTNGQVWKPRNFGDSYQGTVSLRQALSRSKNVATIRLAHAIGNEPILALAQRVGIQGDLADVPSLALGIAELSPLELTTAYTAFASGGERAEPRALLRIETADGARVWESQPHSESALSPAVAFLVTDVLRDALDQPTRRAVGNAGLADRAAGKTGTTNDGTDAWFVGFTPGLAAGVWIGFDDPRPIGSGATGSQLAAPIWAKLMRQMYSTRPLPRTSWRPPEDVVRRPIDPGTGLPLAKGCAPFLGAAGREYFIVGREPDDHCPGQEPPPTDYVTGAQAITWSGPADELEPAAVIEAKVEEEPRRDEAEMAAPTEPEERRSAADAPTRPPAPTRAPKVASAPRVPTPLPDLAREQPEDAAELPNVSGEWELKSRIESSNYPEFEGLQLGFRLRLSQDGVRVFGEGRKLSENGRALAPAGRTSIVVEGEAAPGGLRLRFREEGRRRNSYGTFSWRLDRSRQAFDGTFTSSAADTKGSITGRRLR